MHKNEPDMTMLCPCYAGEAAWVRPAAWAAVSTKIWSDIASNARGVSRRSAVDQRADLLRQALQAQRLLPAALSSAAAQQ